MGKKINIWYSNMIESKVLHEHWDIDRRLSEMKLDRVALLAVRDISIAAASNATPFHPANAAGTFSYQEGTWALRDKIVGADWTLDRSESVEVIKNEELNIKIGFCNVDRACNGHQGPKPRSRKGTGTERICSGNEYQADLFGESAKHFVLERSDKGATYYLMVDKNGAVELTMPIFKGATFSGYVERIFLSNGDDLDAVNMAFDDDGDRADDFDPLVARK